MKKFLIITFLIFIVVAVGLFFILTKTGPQENGQTPEGGGFFQNLFPFNDNGTGNGSERPPSPSTQNPEGISSPVVLDSGATLQPLSNVSTGGYVASTSENGDIFVRYVERTSGNVFDVELATLSTERVTNTTLPRIHDAVFHRNAEHVIVRYAQENNDVIKTYVASIIADTATSSLSEFKKLEGGFFEDGVDNLLMDPTQTKVLLTIPEKLGLMGYVLDFENEEKTPSFESDFGEWIIDWAEEDTLTATTKASHIADGFMYAVDLNTGTFQKLFGGEKGLTALANSDLSKIFFSKTNSTGRISSHVFDRQTQTITDLEIATLAHKCVWSKTNNTKLYCGAPTLIPQGELPDKWYQGVVQFTDNIWEIDTETYQSRELANPVTTLNVAIDAIDLSLANDERLLLFRNKKDSTLWSLLLPQIIEENSATTSEEVAS